MSCLAGIEDEDKDADPEMNPFNFLQESSKMSEDPVSYIDSFGRSASCLVKHSSVLDVLSNTEMLSTVGLGNGPSSHRAMETEEFHSLSTEREEEKSITQLKTVQEIDTAGIWGFDVDSPDNSLDKFGPSNDLGWDPRREFMQFLWDNHDDSPGEELPEEVPPTNNQRRRKRKMDMVVMVDPSEELYPDLSLKSPEASDEDEKADPMPVNKVRNLRKNSNSQSPPTGIKSQFPNGTVKAIKQILYSAPAKTSHEKSIAEEFPPLNSYMKSLSCSKCNIVFKKERHLQRHMKLHVDPTTALPKSFICRECGHSFLKSYLLLEHMTIHQEKRERLIEEIKGMNDLKDEGNNAKLCCPQCSFGTNCANTFVQHAKSHKKDKRYFNCKKCNFEACSVFDLERHVNKEHSVNNAEVENLDITFEDSDSELPSFSCNLCSYSTYSKKVFKNHLDIRHQQTYEKYMVSQKREKNAQEALERHLPICTSPLAYSPGLAWNTAIENSTFERKDLAYDSNDISDLFKKDKIVNKTQRGLRSQLTESKLDKSINNLLSRQRRDKKCEALIQESNGEKSDDMVAGKAKDPCFNNHRKLSTSELSYSGCDPSVAESICSDPRKTPPRKVVLDQQVVKKSPSKRKMSTPFRNTTDQDSCFILPKHLPSPKRLNMADETDDSDEKDIFPFTDTDANTNLFDKTEFKQEKPHIIYTYSRRMSVRETFQASDGIFDKVQPGRRSQNKPTIKEECIETKVFGDSFDSRSIQLSDPFTDVDPSLLGLDSEQKTCPYCPAVFESGVGLSNHVRGHLHRVGLSYNARHVVPPEQVASQDKRPRIRRKMSAIRRLKKALKLESDSDVIKSTHSCPLCGDSFDNKTGQSNHIRGHLKRLGKNISTKNKSPLCLLRELMRDKKEVQRALLILGKKRNPFQVGSSSRLANLDRLAHPSVGAPKRNSIPNLYNDAKPQVPKFSLSGDASNGKDLETKLEVKGSLSSASALIGILKKRKCQEDYRLKTSHSRNALTSHYNEHSTGSRLTTALPTSTSEKGEFNRKVCVHCNATFHSGVSLSNHLRAYAKRKKNALLDGTTYDCKQQRQRSRPGSKKKLLPTPHSPEEMYRLTCRFCDLVFQGPLSVQEDWIKHLQRHIMNASVPHTGASMREVTPLSKDCPPLITDQQKLPFATHVAS